MSDSCIPWPTDPGAITSGSGGSKFLEPGLHVWSLELAAGRDVSLLLRRQEILSFCISPTVAHGIPPRRGASLINLSGK